MARVGIVKEISGVAKAVSSDGSVRVLVVGDVVEQGDLIVTIGDGSSVKLSFDGGGELKLGAEERTLLDESVYANEAFDNQDVQIAQDALLNGEDLPTEATALGDTGANDGGFTPAYVAERTDGRGDVSSYNLGTDGPVSSDVATTFFDPSNTPPDALDDDVSAYENVLFSGNLFDNDTDDGLPNPPADLDLVSVNGIGDTNEDGFITITTEYGTLNVNVETGEYEYLSDFDPLAFGESVVESFEYVVTDGQLTDTATLNITLNGTNDQPSVEALNDSGWLLRVGNDDEEENGDDFITPQISAFTSSVDLAQINEFISGSVEVQDVLDPSEEPTNGSALKLFLDVSTGETVSFNWTFFDAEGEGQTSYNDFSFVVIDGEEIQLLASAFDAGAINEGVFSYTFTEAGVHEIVFGVMNEDDTAVDPSLQILHTSGGEIIDIQTIGIVEDASINYESSDLDETDTNEDGIIANDEAYNVLSGSLIATDVDTSDTHIFRLVDIEDEGAISVSYNSGNDETDEGSEIQILVNSPDVNIEDITIEGITLFNNDQGDRVSDFEVRGDFSALGVGESATVTFMYVADDMHGFGEGELPNESSVSEPAMVTMTIVGTNDQPVVEDVSITQNEVLDGLNTFEGTLDTVSDNDVNDTHTYEMVGDLEVDSPVDVSIESFVLNPDGSYLLVGDFNALAVGESAVMTFQYVANDGHGFDGDSLNENSVSEVQTVTFTVSGTNDQPVVSVISLGQSSISDVVTFENDEDIRIPAVGTSGTVYSNIEITDTGMISDLNVHINLTHTWDNDLNISLRAPDGTIVSLSSYNGGSANNYTNTVFDDEADTSITAGSAPFSGVFRPEGDLSVLDGMDMSGTWTLIISDDAGLDAGMLYNWSLELSVDNQQYIYESHDDDAYQNGLLDTQDDVVTTFSGSLATAIDDDVNDTHEYFMVTESESVDSIDIDSNLITEFGVIVNPDGTYVVEGNFNALAVGESATVTFDYYAQDSAQGGLYDGTDGINESSTSESATVTLIITGTNDQPIVEDVSITVTEASLEDILAPIDSEYNILASQFEQEVAGIEDYRYSGQLSVSDDDINDMGLHVFEWDASSVQVSITTSNAMILNLLAQHEVNPVDAETFIESFTDGYVDFSYIDANEDDTMESATLSTTVALPEELVFDLIDMGILVIDVQEDGSYTVASPLFNMLGANDSFTVDFNYRADDTQGMDGTDGVNEDSVSEWATLSLTIQGTNDQPVAFPYETSVYESSLINADVNEDQIVDEDSRFEGSLPFAQEDGHDFYPLIGRLLSGMDEDLLDIVTMKYFQGDAEVITEGALLDDSLVSVVDPTLTSVVVDEGGTFSIENPTFNNLALGESVTVTFDYYIDDMSDNDIGEAHNDLDNPNEPTHSEPQSVTVTIMGTNDQPVIEDVSFTAIESHDSDVYQNNIDDTQDDLSTMLIGTLYASDEDTNDEHFFSVGSITASEYYGQGNGGPGANGDAGDIKFEEVDVSVDIDGDGVSDGVVKVMVESLPTEVGHITIDSLVFLNNDGLDSQVDFQIVGDFNSLGVGESAQVVFKYYANDMQGIGEFDTTNEASLSAPKYVTVTITGTNDQPIIESIHTINAMETDLASVTYGTDTTFLASDLASDVAEGSAVKLVVDTAAGEEVSFDWAFDLRDWDYMQDNAFVIVDGEKTILADGSIDADGTFGVTFTTAGEHTIIVGVLNNHDDQDFSGSSTLSLTNIIGGVVISSETYGAVVGSVATGGFDLSANSDLSVDGLAEFVSTQEVTYENAHLFGSLEDFIGEGEAKIVNVQDDDDNDDYSYLAFDDRLIEAENIVESHNDDSSIDLITTPVRISLDENGNYDIVSSSFDKLGYGDSVAITFDIQVRDDSGIVDGGDATNEDPISEPKTVTIIIEGTNDTPVLHTIMTDDVMETDLIDFDSMYSENSYLVGQAEANISDEDTNDNHTFVPIVSGIASIVDTNGVIVGDVTVDMDSSGLFNLYNPTFNNLGVGESVMVSFDVQVMDDSGVGVGDSENESATSNTQTLTFMVTGTNDQPTVEAVTVGADEADGTNTDTTIVGTFLGSDEDSNDSLTYTVHDADVAPSNAVYLPYFVDNTYMGVIAVAVSLASGSEVDVDDLDLTSLNIIGDSFTLVGNFDALPEGESLDIQFQYSAQDDSGVGTGNTYDENDTSSMQTVTVTVTGTNDTPIITPRIAQGDVYEILSPSVARGVLDIADPDAGESEFNTIFDSLSPTSYGTFTVDSTGVWSYTLDDSAAQSLGDEVVTEVFRVYSEDDSGVYEDVTIYIHGDNDAPFITNETFSLDTNELLPIGNVIGTVSATDVDGPSLTYSLVDIGGYATVDDYFEIDSSTGAISLKAGLDAENMPSTYDLYVKVDDGSLSDTQKFTVNIADITANISGGDIIIHADHDFNYGNNFGWNVGNDDFWTLGSFNEYQVVSREFDLGTGYENTLVTIEFDLILNQPGQNKDWDDDDFVAITVNGVTTTQYGTEGDGVYPISIEAMSDSAGKVVVSLDSSTNNIAERWSIDNFTMTSETDEVLTFEPTSVGEIDFAQLISQNNDFNPAEPSSLDEVNLTGTSVTLTNITAEDVLNITDSDNTLAIHGDSSSHIDMSGWVFESSNSDVSIYSAVYDGTTTVTLEIDNGVDIIVS
jgi:VCBS repeat-containing protein